MIDLEAIRTVAEIPAAWADCRGGAVAIKFDEHETTYSELELLSDRVAQALVGSGVSPEGRVSTLTKNHLNWYPVFFGTARARACFSPINCRLAPAEVSFILNDAKPKLLFVGEDLFDCAPAATSEMTDPPHLVALYGEHPAFEPFETWHAGSTGAEILAPPQINDDVLQLYTSGTTGHPKGVVLTNDCYRAFLEQATEVEGFAYDEDETVMIVMPLFHVAGTNVSISSLAQGSRLLIIKDFIAADVLRLMSEERVAHVFLAPAMIQMLLLDPEVGNYTYPKLRSIAYGASPIAEDVLKRARETFGCDFVQFYGMTESAGAGSYLAPADHDLPDKLASCGKPWPGTDMAILDPRGHALEDEEIGEIAMRGRIVMKEYWNRPAATREALADGWLHTGDVGYRDADGFYYVHDRIKDMIVSGGENVYPAEVEGAIMGCPGVADIAVIGVPDEKWGESVKALVVPGSGSAPEPADILRWARDRIAAYKVPKSIEFVSELPRNPSGKVLRRELRAPYWKEHDRAVA